MTELNIGETKAVACQKLVVASKLCFGDCMFVLKRGDGGTNAGWLCSAAEVRMTRQNTGPVKDNAMLIFAHSAH